MKASIVPMRPNEDIYCRRLIEILNLWNFAGFVSCIASKLRYIFIF